MELKSKFIVIPNIIANDNELSINSKYLYGWIQNEIYYGEFNKSMNDIIDVLQCSISTARKCLKELKDKRYIMIEILNGNQRKITPMVSDSMILNQYNKTKLKEDYKKTHTQEEINATLCKVKEKNKTPTCILKFLADIKTSEPSRDREAKERYKKRLQEEAQELKENYKKEI